MDKRATHTIWHRVQNQLQQEGAILLPLRLFIGLGWTRAALEKLLNPDWHHGTALVRFFEGQIGVDAISFPFYQSLVVELFTPYAQFLSWVIMSGDTPLGLQAPRLLAASREPGYPVGVPVSRGRRTRKRVPAACQRR
ncbi:MAG: hypothetical protein KatS3mg057_1209 [Herpetosiphonaceae bacterium]|nr:MAG: hypothetical protein KatS3mg057_1209 [Herpetosiphonaceae bacterium]